MKQFFKSVFTHLFALCLFFGGIFVLGMVLIVGIAATGEKRVTVPKNAILMLDLGMNITDAPPSFDPNRFFAEIQGAKPPASMSLRALIEAIDAAAADDRIQSMHISGNLISINYGSGYAALREVREAILRFRGAGKFVSAYFVYADTRDYYLASAADEIVLHPSGGLGILGLGSEQAFWKGFFDKYGIGITVVRSGKYKSFAETLTRSSFSPEEREQLTALLGGLWAEIVTASAEGRGVDAAEFQRVIDSGKALLASQAVETRLATRIAKEEEMLSDLAERATGDPEDLDFPQIDILAYASHERTESNRRNSANDRIAVVYAEGQIVDGQGELDEVGADRLVSVLQDIREDDDVRAVVLRVNSPGGSGIASDRILDAVRPLRERGLPIVVSMGTVAASGGYYISMASDRIFVQPNTITGSIGVVGVIPDLEGLATRHGITTDRVETGRYANMGSLLRPLAPDELSLVQGLVDDFYERFLAVVSEGRNMDRDAVHAVAQGRVWTGPAAISAGLADEIGGLEQAIREAAKLAGVTEYRIREYPRQQRFEEFLEEAMRGTEPMIRAASASSVNPVDGLVLRFQEELRSLRRLNDPRGIYLLLPYDLTLD